MKINKVSSAYISGGYIQLAGYTNPELILPDLLRTYFEEVGYMEKYSYFKTLRIGAVHPFAVLLFQEVSGSKSDVNLFPSITVADTNDNESDSTLGKEYEEVMFSRESVLLLDNAVKLGTVLTSEENITAMINATENNAKIFGKKRTYRATHNIDINIWADNKDMVSLIYDLTKHALITNIPILHEKGIDINGSLTGRRSGDINVEFGSLLFGANITIPATIETTDMTVDLNIKEIGSLAPFGNYHLRDE